MPQRLFPVEEQIRRRAYELWEDQGRPAGREHEHWLQAEREILGQGGEVSGGAPDQAGSRVDPATGPVSGQEAGRHDERGGTPSSLDTGIGRGSAGRS
ncbi:DUF2934 domain-containing protein [Telmatospirillum sp. J64-1]|uniref:DUF2934 domain-containing protein n=1 Tax=Telmatospirillum sp. J64-1 TaxID=2502183 RepID=UPI00115EB85E|nr:DUF2934 domain-containing protein [Telmatospirillum sp. J64-1]